MSLPSNYRELYDAGWRRRNYGCCQACKAPVEWWWTPERRALCPMEIMRQDDSLATSHFAVCPYADEFRNKKKPAAKASGPAQQSLFDEIA